MSRRRREIENTEFLAWAKRLIRRGGERIAETGDPADLAELVALRAEIDAAITVAVRGLREQTKADGEPWSWGQIGAELGISRQAAQQAYARRRAC